ncbi:hypothetical protein AAG565_08490 [Fontimonas sp. SYSU GA230001]|uniref:hypothetical protein n=1 Tax=Fontimonas sp. SYSU GA230001 TaxID=3142450 RepID=UPI0032B54BC9
MSRRGGHLPARVGAAPTAEVPAAETPVKSVVHGRGPAGWIIGAAGALGALLAGVWLAGWLWLHLVIHIPISDQPVGIALPAEFGATAKVTNVLDVAMKGEIATAVPFRQALTVPLRGRYDLDVELNAQVPVQFEVIYDGTLPVDTSAKVTIRTGINYKNLKSLRNLTIRTALPLKFQLPVHLRIPIREVLDVSYSGPLSADLDHDLKTTVDTVLRTRLPIDQTVRTPVTAAIPLRIRPDQAQTRLILTRLDVVLRPSTMLDFGVAAEDRRGGPLRVSNPYGPLDRDGPEVRPDLR